MKALNGQSTGSSISASDWNQLPSEIQNVIEDAGLTLADGVVIQLAIAISHYVARSDFYTGAGTANAQTLTPIGSIEVPDAYLIGMRVRWRPSNNNTGAATIDVDGLGAQTIVQEDGSTALAAGNLNTARMSEAWYDGTNFVLVSRNW